MQPSDANIDARYRTLVTIWCALVMSLVLYIVYIHFVTATAVSNHRLSLLLICLSLVPMAISLLAKQAMVGKAIERQQVQSVHSAYVVAWALCEMSALLGLMDYFLTGSSRYYFEFAIGGLGMLLHFPRKKHLLDATYKPF